MPTATVQENPKLKNQASKDEADIRALIELVHQAHHDKDAVAIARPFAKDAAIYDLSPPLAHRGVSAPAMQKWLDGWNGPIDMESRDLSVTVDGDSAFCHGFFRMTGDAKAAGRVVSFWMRATVCLLRKGGEWNIVHEHTSVPFYMDGSLRPAFDLEP